MKFPLNFGLLFKMFTGSHYHY